MGLRGYLRNTERQLKNSNSLTSGAGGRYWLRDKTANQQALGLNLTSDKILLGGLREAVFFESSATAHVHTHTNTRQWQSGRMYSFL